MAAKTKPPIERPPGPRSRSLLGHLLPFRRDPLQTLTDLQRTYGDLVYFRLAYQHAYFVAHPDLIKEILVTQQSNFIKSRALQRSKIILGEGLLTSEGQTHLRQRRLIQPAFHRERLQAYGAAMVELAERKLADWERRRIADKPLDLHEEMVHLTLTIVAKTLFHSEVEDEVQEVGKVIANIIEMFPTLILPFSEYLQKLPLPVSRRMRQSKARLDELIYKMIAERRADPEDRGDLLSMLLMAQDTEGDGTGMSDQQVRDEALTLFLAGHETTANALSWCWYLLSQHPDVEQRFHEELDRVLNGRLPNAADIESLRYTYAVLAETMRLYPPAWAMGRSTLQDFDLGGYRIPSGSICILSQWVTHRDPRFFPEPERFNPERWFAPDDRPKFAYFPFGGGSRVCIGERFAWMEGVLLLAAIGQRWRFELADGATVVPQALITLRPRGSLPMVPRKR